jgi:polyisoprenyl-phosphate glycosyltransferase
MRLSLVVPCYNEEAVLARFHQVARAETAGLGCEVEIVFADDGSKDETLPILQKLAAEDPLVRYVSFSRNFGKEAGMLAGLREATGDAVIILDADLQHPPELIGQMLDLHRQGYDQVIARRDREGDKVARTIASRLYYWVINKWVDVELQDGVGDFRLLSRRAVDSLLTMREYNRFSKGLFAWIGFDSVTFQYANVSRDEGATKWTFRKLVNYGFDGLISFNNRPLRAAIYVGMALTLVALGYMVWIIASAVDSGVQTPGYVTIITAVIGLGGLQMTILGVIGEYIGRIYYEVKRRPHYLVKERHPAPNRNLD